MTASRSQPDGAALRREALIHAICPHIKQWCDAEPDKTCAKCPATVQTSQGEGVQMCRLNAEEAADDVLALTAPQGAGPITTEQLDKLQFGRQLHERPQGADTREAVIEECAKVADDFAAFEQTVVDRSHDDGALSDTARKTIGYAAGSRQVAAEQIAHDIRALRSSTEGADTREALEVARNFDAVRIMDKDCALASLRKALEDERDYWNKQAMDYADVMRTRCFEHAERIDAVLSRSSTGSDTP